MQRATDRSTSNARPSSISASTTWRRGWRTSARSTRSRGRPYLLVVGNAFWHKNRLFALRLLQWLIEQRGWEGGLVLAGEHPGRGSSVAAERSSSRDAHRCVTAWSTSAASRTPTARRSIARRRLVVFPSLYEGFGLIPFEAAHFGTASVYTHRASMRELAP